MKVGPHPRQKLTSISTKKITSPGRHADGNGLYLLVDNSGAKRWVQRLVIKGRRTDMGLGSCDCVTLASARATASANRQVARQGGDPVAERKKQRRLTPTFKEASESVHQDRLPTYRNAKHAAQWINTLRTYAFPKIGSLSVAEVTPTQLAAVLSPIWTTKQETASRLKQRIWTVCEWSKGHGYIVINPADNLKSILPPAQKSRRHHASVDYKSIPEFMTCLRSGPSSEQSKLGLELVMLTCLRTSEVRLGLWAEINWENNIWTIPAERQNKTKNPEEHVVPLTQRCMEILTRLRELSGGNCYIFPGATRIKPISEMTFLMAMRRLGRKETVHGFRATARTWAEEETNHSPEILEKALSHTIKDKVQAAYRRGNLLEKRRIFMEDWQNYTMSKSYEIWKSTRRQTGAT